MLDSIRVVDELLTSRISRTPVEPAEVQRDLLQAASGGEETKAVFELVPRIFDVPLDLRIIPKLQEPALLLCRSAVATLAVDGGWLQLVEEFFRLLAWRVRRPQAVRLKRYPFLFHVLARRQAVKTGGLNAYEALALRGHSALRGLEEEMHHSPRPFGAARRLDNLYRYSRTIRRIIEYVRVKDLPPPESLHEPLPVPVVDAAFLGAGAALGRPTRESWNQTLEDDYGRGLALFCSPRRIHPRYRRGLSGPRIRALRTGPRGTSYVEEVEGRETIITVRVAPRALEEGESAWDYSTAVEVPGDEDRSAWAPPGGRVARTSLSTPYDPGVAQPPELLALYCSFLREPPDAVSRTDLVLGLAALTIVHYGAEPADVLGMVSARPVDPAGPRLWINPERLTLSHNLPDDLPAHKTRPPGEPDECLPSGALAELPLLPPLAALTSTYEACRQSVAGSGPYLRLDTPDGLRPVTLADLERWLGRVSPHLTPARLRQTFMPLYMWAGLEPILCAFVANRFGAGLRATAFYVNIGLRELARRYAHAHRRMLALIGVRP